MSLEVLDTVALRVAVIDGDGLSWPAGTTGAIVDLGDDSALVEVVERDTGRTLALIGAEVGDLVPIPLGRTA